MICEARKIIMGWCCGILFSSGGVWRMILRECAINHNKTFHFIAKVSFRACRTVGQCCQPCQMALASCREGLVERFFRTIFVVTLMSPSCGLPGGSL